MAIESLTTLDLPMAVDSIGIYELKEPYCTLTMADWFLQALSVIPRGSGGDVARCFTMIRWAAVDLLSGPRLESCLLRQTALEELTNLSRTEPPRRRDRNKSNHEENGRWQAAADGRRRKTASGGREVEVERGGRRLEARVLCCVML
ncbi:hypothetical protein F511_27166 [Dorcoceras hygrometricum]|uniref:Uncharacterized protein n=1 Tax=Dorcoceras hygrometricum TaxID=472368 RepID=A0A2Z7A8N1_9LAMI|nr:hypothetical protein F511_27166 [Dorcoceras hygrometricum]